MENDHFTVVSVKILLKLFKRLNLRLDKSFCNYYIYYFSYFTLC